MHSRAIATVTFNYFGLVYKRNLSVDGSYECQKSTLSCVAIDYRPSSPLIAPHRSISRNV